MNDSRDTLKEAVQSLLIERDNYRAMLVKCVDALNGAEYMFETIEKDLTPLNPAKDCTGKCSSYGHDILCGNAGLLALHEDEDVIAVTAARDEARKTLENK